MIKNLQTRLVYRFDGKSEARTGLSPEQRAIRAVKGLHHIGGSCVCQFSRGKLRSAAEAYSTLK